MNIKVTREMGGNNALLYACNSSNSNYHLVDYLISEGADPDSMNDYAVNCLLIATKKSQWMMLNLLLEKGVHIGYQDKNGCNALHIASAAGFTDIVEMILLYWSKQKMAAAREAAGLEAIGSGSTTRRRKINSSKSFEIDCLDKSYTTSLMKASINGHVKIVRLLLRFGSDPRKTNQRGETALTLACM